MTENSLVELIPGLKYILTLFIQGKRQLFLDHHLAGFDRQFRQTGIIHLCGIDEAGRGPLAGPVVAAALILKDGMQIPGINDSKKLDESMRENLEPQIKENALSYGIGSMEPHEIDRINILQATFEAMRRAVNALSIQPEYLIVDGRDFPKFFHKQSMQAIKGSAIIKGIKNRRALPGRLFWPKYIGIV